VYRHAREPREKIHLSLAIGILLAFILIDWFIPSTRQYNFLPHLHSRKLVATSSLV
jgi:hypothetical protein